MRRLAPLLLLLFAACASSAPDRRTNLRIVTDEADAVLAILDARAAGRDIGDADWQRVFASEGYVRLKKREHSMGRPFEDDAFRAFAMSPELLAKRAALHAALDRIKRADLAALAARAYAYLPPSAAITARVYPVVKPRENSFVFEGNAIFKYLEDEPLARFEETVAHELHHIGYGTACSAADDGDFRKWLGAFGEGFAVLAAGAGARPGAGAHTPYASAAPDVREAWRKGIADPQFAALERFFGDLLDGTLKGDAADKRGFEFFGLVGPWYTVGWTMATTIEQELGRQALIDAFCDTRTLLATYNRAAAAREKRTGQRLPRWSERLAAALVP